MEVNPLSIILVKSDSKGDRLLFRYPYHIQENNEPANKRRRNPYTLSNVEDILQTLPQSHSNINNGYLTGFTDGVLSSLFAVKPELCNRKFELKVNDVRFVSHPTLLQLRNKKHDESGVLQINIVFSLQALASQSVVQCYHDLSKRMGILLRHEGKRCGFINDETQVMMAAHDDLNPEAAFDTILEKCSIAKNLKKMYEDLCSTGFVNIRINKWIPLSFCLPQKVHQWHLYGKLVEPDDINRCIKALRPYHSILLLCPINMMNDFISLDGSPSLIRMLTQYSPLKNLQILSLDSDLTLSHIFDLTAHLVYWAKATVIYPICLTNKYVISSEAPIYLKSPLVDKFSEAFPGMNLIRALSEFSLPSSLGQKCTPLGFIPQHSQLVEIIVWMLQNHLLLQLHMYTIFIPDEQMATVEYDGVSVHQLNNKIEQTKSRHTSESGNSTDGLNIKNLDSNNVENLSINSIEEDKQKYQEEITIDVPNGEQKILFKVTSENNLDDLKLFAKLCRKKYFQGSKHVEEIMYLENLRRSQLLQLLDKFRDVLITYETEDATISLLPSYDS